jgi:hypothetical protein
MHAAWPDNREFSAVPAVLQSFAPAGYFAVTIN